MASSMQQTNWYLFKATTGYNLEYNVPKTWWTHVWPNRSSLWLWLFVCLFFPCCVAPGMAKSACQAAILIKIRCRRSWCTEDKSYWLGWFSNFSQGCCSYLIVIKQSTHLFYPLRVKYHNFVKDLLLSKPFFSHFCPQHFLSLHLTEVVAGWQQLSLKLI